MFLSLYLQCDLFSLLLLLVWIHRDLSLMLFLLSVFLVIRLYVPWRMDLCIFCYLMAVFFLYCALYLNFCNWLWFLLWKVLHLKSVLIYSLLKSSSLLFHDLFYLFSVLPLLIFLLLVHSQIWKCTKMIDRLTETCPRLTDIISLRLF